jgi:hypothetical protein
MSTEALVFMVTVQTTVTIITAYFFYRVLRTPPKSDVEREE